MRRPIPLVVGLALLVASPTPALALLWIPYNLNSLVMSSDAIVLAEKVGTRSLAGTQASGLILTSYEVRKVFAGALLPGEVLEIYDGYSRDSFTFGGTGLLDDSGQKLEFDDDVVLFLRKFDRTPRSSLSSLPEADRPRFEIVHSGLRLLADGRVFEFMQFINPGAPQPTPMTRRGGRLGDPTQRVHLKEFEKDIREALARVETLRHAREVEDPVRRRELLLGTLGEYEEEARWRRKWLSSSTTETIDGTDIFLQGIVDLFTESGDVQGVLEVAAIWPWKSVKLPAEAAVYAVDPTLEPRLRVAAIETLRRSLSFGARPIEALQHLLDDPNDEVRDAARECLRIFRYHYRDHPHLHTWELDTLYDRVGEKLHGRGTKDAKENEKETPEEATR